MNRRGFLQASLASGSADLLAESEHPRAPVVDTHVYVSRWPGRRMYGDETPELVEILRKHGVVQAWTGSFDALLHKDVGGVNYRLARECTRAKDLLVPFGAINPKLPDWEEELRRCQEEYRMPGVRLHPNYHGYTLRDPSFAQLLHVSAERGLIVQIAAWMEDERTHNPLLRVPTVDLQPLPALLEKYPKAKVMVLNGFISTWRLERLLEAFTRFNRVAFDFAMLDGLMGVRAMIDVLGVERVAFGSYSPMFYTESALLKVREADLTREQQRAVFADNARRLMS